MGVVGPRRLDEAPVLFRPVRIRPLGDGDLAVVLALNNQAVPAVNPHDEASFATLVAMADRCWVADVDGDVAGFLVVFAPGAAYESANYRWLSARYEDFRYVDRIVVAETHRGRGVAASLYETLLEHGRAVGATDLLCEVNVEPPNPGSLAFHAAVGWQPVGELQHAPGKVVRFHRRDC